MIDPAQRLPGLEPAGIIFLGNEHRQEECAFSAFTSSRKIPLSVSLSFAHAAAVVELAIQRMYVRIEHKRTPMNLQCSCRDIWGGLIAGRAIRETSTPKK